MISIPSLIGEITIYPSIYLSIYLSIFNPHLLFWSGVLTLSQHYFTNNVQSFFFSSKDLYFSFFIPSFVY